MKYEPRVYQQYGIDLILQNPYIALWAEPGTGKTSITLTAIAELLHNRFEVSRVLVIAPLRVAQTVWTEEAEKWEHLQHLRINRVIGSERHRHAVLDSPGDIWVINRENVAWLYANERLASRFDMVVIDESSSFKDPQAKRFKFLRRVRPHFKRLVELTGTPAPNGYLDIWPQVYLLDGGARLHKTLGGYRERFFQPGAKNGHIVYSWSLKDGAKEAIHDRIDDICVSLLAKDWIDLKPCYHVTKTVTLPPQSRILYNRLEKDLLLQFADGDITADTAAVLSNKLLQMANGAVYDENKKVITIHNAKIDALEDIVEAANGHPVLVFYWFKHDLERLKARFPQAKTLDGEKEVRDWNAGKIDILFAHPQSCGHGLNLQYGGNTIVWFSLLWSLEFYEQANARLTGARQHYEKAFIHHIVAADTIDEQAIKRLEQKEKGQSGLKDAVKFRVDRIKSQLEPNNRPAAVE